MQNYLKNSLMLIWITLCFYIPSAFSSGSANDDNMAIQNLEAMFDRWDLNHDGKLSRAEWRGKTPFDQVDRDRDGFITKDDLQPIPSEKQSSKSGFAEVFDSWDTNDDGKLSSIEWKGRTPFERVDKNGDGFVTKDEIGLGGTERTSSSDSKETDNRFQRFFTRMDANHDGKISKDEWKGNPSVFDHLDQDQDSVITSAEMAAASGAFQQSTSKISEKKEKSVAKQHPQDPAKPTSGSDTFQRMLKAMDANHDGKISSSEWNGGESTWEKLDKNKDGFVTADEVE